MSTPPFPGLRWTADSSAARWVEDSVGPFDYTVNSLLPSGFAAYGRVLHPAKTESGELVSWRSIATWSGTQMHSRTQFWKLRSPAGGARSSVLPWDEAPEEGAFPATLLPELCRVLAEHTDTPDSCVIGLWEGLGWCSSPAGSDTVRFAADAAQSSVGASDEPIDAAQVIGSSDRLPARVAPAVAPIVEEDSLPRLRLPARAYLLLQGPLDAIGEIGDRGEGFFFPQSPNIFWPDDREWCVATDVDLNSTYIAGTTSLISDLLAHQQLEAVPSALRDPIDRFSDHLNA